MFECFADDNVLKTEQVGAGSVATKTENLRGKTDTGIMMINEFIDK